MDLNNLETLLQAKQQLLDKALSIHALLSKVQAEGRQPTDDEMTAILAPQAHQAATNKGPIWGNL